MNHQIPNPLPSLENQPKNIQCVYSSEKIDELVTQIANQVNEHYKNKKLLLVGVLKGSVIFMADLIRKLDMEVEVDFVHLSSYGKSLTSSGTVTVMKDIGVDIKDRHVLIIEEIIDTGRTLKFLFDRLYAAKPASLKITALFDKKSKREININADFIGCEVDDHFLIGYGLDLNQTCRNLKDVFYLEF